MMSPMVEGYTITETTSTTIEAIEGVVAGDRRYYSVHGECYATTYRNHCRLGSHRQC